LSLCANDIVGLQTYRDARNFLHTCEAFFPNADVDYRQRAVTMNGHRTLVRPYPISVEVGELRRMMVSGRVREYEAKLRPLLGEHTIVRVDRAEPSKNVLRGFMAFDLLLERHPELADKLRFLVFLVPSRTHIRQYQRYMEDINRLVERINAKYSTEGSPIIRVFYENNYPQAIAGMKLYDVLLVNAVIDGMNLVAKEGPIVNGKDGVLVLSESVGAYEQLAEGALAVSPADIDGTAKALYEALTMPAEERKRRAAILREIIEQNDLPAWVCQQMGDLDALTEASAQAAS
ncbi:MAG: trehalose-6-phosphate synthase, partial [Chloroflexi bacterium]|nr:trehalose-6-phosphate synthase [Chloroflexota bacterium]